MCGSVKNFLKPFPAQRANAVRMSGITAQILGVKHRYRGLRVVIDSTMPLFEFRYAVDAPI